MINACVLPDEGERPNVCEGTPSPIEALTIRFGDGPGRDIRLTVKVVRSVAAPPDPGVSITVSSGGITVYYRFKVGCLVAVVPNLRPIISLFRAPIPLLGDLIICHR
jgi:hypothetical protein